MVTFLNPNEIHPPLSSYSHTALVPAGTELVFISGQVGARPDGSVPESFAEQAEWVYKNIDSCLFAHGLDMRAVVKLNTFLVSGQDVQAMRVIRKKYLSNHTPASTSVFVPQLVSPALLIEIETVAVKHLPANQNSQGAV
jgi:2-iminobutanoate/2-iminopropanoate deaminase